MAAGGAGLAPPAPAGAPNPFVAWAAEWDRQEQLLDGLPADDEIAREPLLARIFDLQDLILNTPATELAAIRIKAASLLWLMEMEHADGLLAMRHIHDWLFHHA